MNRAGGAGAALRKLLLKHSAMALVLILVLALVSGRRDWLRAWLYVGITLGIQLTVGIVLQRRSPDLLAERSRIRQGTKGWDKLLVAGMAILGPLAIWLVAAWDVRRHWPPPVPTEWSAAALAICALGSVLTAWAMMTNRFFSATVRIQSERGHRVIETGPYRYVRHPGYIGALAFTLASPVALGSWAALIPAAITAVMVLVRTAIEDQTLRAELPGYLDYAGRVPNRLVPGVW